METKLESIAWAPYRRPGPGGKKLAVRVLAA
jgi:hypothetical protein